jgi:hypothetical protein
VDPYEIACVVARKSAKNEEFPRKSNMIILVLCCGYNWQKAYLSWSDLHLPKVWTKSIKSPKFDKNILGLLKS